MPRGGSSSFAIPWPAARAAQRQGGPACFPGNIIPANRLNSNGKALLNMLPRANNFDRTFTQGQFNYTTQENAENPKMNNVVRVDWKPTIHDSFYFTFKDWYSDQRGSEITAGPNKWGFFNTHYLNTDRGVSANYTRILSPTTWSSKAISASGSRPSSSIR